MRNTFDVAIIGGGPIGMVTACAMRSLGYSILLIEKRAAETPRDDRRVIALSHGSRLVLQRLGLWDAIKTVSPIERILVSEDGNTATVNLDASECQVPALGYVATFNDLLEAFASCLAGLTDVEVCFGHDAEVAGVDDRYARVRLRGALAAEVRAALVLHAEGVAMGDDMRRKDYRQHAVVAQVWTDSPPNSRAFEHFTEAGSVALLPLGDHFSLVWTVPSEEMDSLHTQPDAEVVARLQRLLGERAGRILSIGPRASFPLSTHSAGAVAKTRTLRLGNAAQQLHPVAAQGFNLGLRDVWTLYDCLWDSPADPGSAQRLGDYAARRQADRSGSLWLTDTMITTFGSTHHALRLARAGALRTLAASKTLRQLFAHRMMFGAT